MSRLSVKIYYGPSEAFHTVVHRPQKLRGLRMSLQTLGFLVTFIPVEYKDWCLLEMCGYEVFRCKISHLAFNMSEALDPVCARAVDAVIDACKKFTYGRRFLWTQMFVEDQIFKRSFYAPKDHWMRDENYVPLPNYDIFIKSSCADCCGVSEFPHSEDEHKDK